MGQIEHYNDYYGHQQRITLALAGKWDQIDIGEDHLAAVDTSKLKEIRIGSGSARSSRNRGFDSPMGLGSYFGNVRYSPSGDSVGDIVRRSLGFGY